MHVYTIVVQPAAEEDGHIAVVPDLPGLTAVGRTVEECVARAREVIGLVAGPQAATPPAAELTGHAAGASDEAEEEALDALRRAMAALRTVERDLEEEITRTADVGARQPLRRAHEALLRARRALADEALRAVSRLPDHATV
jgi:predicted RNase H-like HicB family nuclease